jgi:P27 family predicted phage terminase small subunit
MSGPPRTPTPILAARGSWLAKTRKREPKPASTAPRCPAWLDKDGKAVWKQVVPMLATMGVLANTDGNALARYCRLWVRWKQADAFIQKYGETYPLKDEKGKVKCFQQHPQVGIVNKLSTTLLRLEQEFGLTPASRSRINVDVKVPPTQNDHGVSFFDGEGVRN